MTFRLHQTDRAIGDVTFLPGQDPILVPANGQEASFDRAWNAVRSDGDPASCLQWYSQSNRRRGRGFWVESLPDPSPAANHP